MFRSHVRKFCTPLAHFKLETSSHSKGVPLWLREGCGLGVLTWDVASPEERQKLNANSHLPVTLPASRSGILPIVFRMCSSTSSIETLAAEARLIIEEHLETKGAVLFRGMPLSFFLEASHFLSHLGYTLYPDPSGRQNVAPGLCHASMSVSPDFNISKHQEHIVSNDPPSKLILYCQSPSEEGGETPLAFARDVWILLQRTTQDQLRGRGVRFEMVRGNAANSENTIKYTRSWQEHFVTNDLQMAMSKASDQFAGTVTVDKHQNIILRSPRLQASRMIDAEEIYCSQLQNIYSLKWMWGDSDEYLPDELLEDVMSAVWNAGTVFQWQAGDVLVVDNIRALHGRLSYKGERYMAAALTRD